MAISTTNIGAGNTTTYTSSVVGSDNGDSAVTFMSICNYGGASVLVNIHIVPSGDAVADGNLFINDIEIIAGDTYVIYRGSEKIMLNVGDFISVNSSISNTVTVVTSSVQV